MKNRRNKKIILGILLVVVIFAIIFNVVFAIDPSQSETSGDDAKKIGAVTLIIASALGWALSVVGNLVDFAIELGNDIFKLDAVTIGWKIVLSFTNLGFVLGIIIIAFATILRMESYGMKQILWKLVVAAFLVNFSLVIAGSFISVSTTITNVFLEATTSTNLSNALADAMQPQKFLKVKDIKDPSLWSMITDAFSYFIKFIFSLLFIAIFTFLTILAFLVLFIMLLVRVIALAFLLILSPIAWLLWIFPGTNKYWNQWWTEFIRWNVFAPAVMFFVYLTVVTAQGLSRIPIKVASGDAAKAAEASLMLGNEAIQHAANLLILLGLLFGGIYVANKFGIAGGSIGVNLAQGTGKAVGKFAGRKSLQYSTGWLSKKRGEPGKEKSYADRISEWSAKSKLAKYTVLPGLAARGIAKFSAAGGENLVKDAKGAASKRSLNENLAMLGYADAPNRQGILQHLQEKDLLDKVPDTIKYIDKKYKAEAARFGQGVGYSNIEKSLGTNVEMKEAFDKFGKDSKQFREAGERFFSKFSEKDWAKPQYNEIYGSKPSHGVSEELHSARQEVFAYAVAEINPGQLAKTMPKIKGANFKPYQDAVNKAITEMEKTNPEKAKKVKESFEKALGRRRLGVDLEMTESAETVKPEESGEKEEKKS